MKVGGEHGDVRLLFPWDDGEGLTSMLRDPKLWAAAFKTPDMRQQIKVAAKKVLNVKGVSHTDDEQLGKLTARLLETRQGRAALYQEFRRYDQSPETFIARRLQLTLRNQGLTIPPVLTRGPGVHFYLDLDALEASPDAFSGWTAERILLAIAPFAILQRSEAGRIVSLLQRNAEVAALLQAELPRAAQALVEDGGTDTGEAGHTFRPTSPMTEVATAEISATAEDSGAPLRSTGAPAQVSDERLARLEAALRTVLGASQRARAAITVGDMDRGLEEVEKAKRARPLVQAEYDRLRAREDVVASGWSANIPSAACGDDRMAEAWLSELKVSLEAHEGHRRELVRRKREGLRADFVRVGLSPPEDLDAAGTLEQVQVIRDREQETIAVETAWQSMLEAQDVSRLERLKAEQRVRLAARLLDLRSYPGLLLRLFVSDDQANKACALERVAPLIREQIAAGESLPEGIWRALQGRAGEALVAVLDAHGLSPLVPGADESSLHADELRQALLSLSLPYTHELYLWSLEARLTLLSPAQRVELLVEVAAASSSPLPIRLLVEALSASERWPEAVMIAAIALRSGRMDDDAVGPTREVFLRVMIDSCQHGERHMLLKNILLSPGDLLRYEEGFITLLYVATHVEPAFVDTLIHGGAAMYEIAVKKYELLVSEWLVDFRAKIASRDAAKTRETEFLKAQAIYAEWLHELDRKSSYTNWPYAQDYQRHIVQALNQKLVILDRSGVLGDEDPDELLQEIRDEYRLPMVEGAARRNMQAFIKEQLTRLQVFAELSRRYQLRGTLVSALQSRYRNLRSGLEHEAMQASGIVRELYNIALREAYS